MTLALIAATSIVSAVELKEEEGLKIISNSHYTIKLVENQGWSIRSVQYGNDRRDVFVNFQAAFDGQHEVFNDRVHDSPKQVWQNKVDAKIVENSAEKVVVRLTKNLEEGGSIIEDMTFDETPLVHYAVDFSWVKSAYDFKICMQSLQVNAEKSIFYPENRNFTGVYISGERSILPRWKYVNDGKFGYGVIALEESAWDHFDFQARTPTTGTAAWGNQDMIWLISDSLCNLPAPGKQRFKFDAIFTPDPILAHQLAATQLKSAPKVQLSDMTPDKVFSEKGAKNGTTVTVINNTAEAKTVKVAVELSTGLDDVTKVGEDTLNLKPWECLVYKKDWSYPEGFEWGVSPRIKLYEGEELLDNRADVVSVSDRGFNAAGCGIINCKAQGQDGAEVAWADNLRRTYIGMVEYYMWSPSTWDPDRKAGQAPVADRWSPVSEHSATKTTLSKKFLKGLIDNCHQRGVHVYDWITGLVNYRQAVAHPEMFQYAANGQLLLYSGKVHGKERHAVAKIAPYTKEQSAEWGDQVADSVDMFGWDGCRWDWGFLPCAPNDPLYMSELGLDPEKFTWYNYKGQPSTELYPDPDTVGMECLRAFRDAVAKRHPKFVNTSNAHATANSERQTPKYCNELWRDTLALLEYIMDFAGKNKKYNVWAETLAEDNMRVRKRGSHSEVGHISCFLENSVGGQLARYACGAAGSKWWGGPADYRYWTAKHRSLPFAMRFSEYFFSLDFVRMSPAQAAEELKVESLTPVYWQSFVYERDHKGRHELICHVINCDPEEIMLRKQPDVKVRGDVAITAPNRNGKAPVEAWAMLPGDEPHAVKLALKNGRAQIPALEEAACVLFKY